jgi:hypothetical protein
MRFYLTIAAAVCVWMGAAGPALCGQAGPTSSGPLPGGKVDPPSSGPLPGGGAQVFKSPEEAFRSAQAAAAKGDWPAFVKILTPETVDMMAGTMIFLGAVAKGHVTEGPAQFLAEKLGEIKGPLGQVFSKHGLSDETLKTMAAGNDFPKLTQPPSAEQLAKLAANIRDRKGFAAEAMTVVVPAMAKFSPNKNPDPFFGDKILKEVQINGTKATGKLVPVINGMEQPGGQPIEFHQINGSWHITVPIVQKKPAPKPTDA